MDPLSITVAITGLLGAAASTATSVQSVISRVKNAPVMIQSLLAEINEVQTAVAYLQNFVGKASQLNKHRASLVSMDQLVATLTEAVLTISEIDTLVKPLTLEKEMPLWDRVRVAFDQTSMTVAIHRLSRNKASLDLMFNILQCESDKEAANSRDELKDLMARILATNQDLCRRLENLESHSVFHRGANSITTAIPELDDLETIRPTEDYQSVKECYGLNASQLRFAFEGILEASRVYKKYQQNECDKSFRNSVALSRAWSYLSDLSLAQISSVSVIALPICANDLSNPQCQSIEESFRLTDTKMFHIHTAGPVGKN
ncbi:MAG: hypothetical protein LQ340_002558 [Diploschistes diacapsis]|nr:MAG: hypothetical protein LQ340_002558 [Diploschistes diacapsis]